MANDLIEIIEGEFGYCLFKSDSYMVCRFLNDDFNIIVTGPSFEFEKNQLYKLTGNYINHPKYGRQFSYFSIEKILPTKKDEIVNFLASATFPGIGKRTALKIYNYFNDDTLNILKDNFSLIEEVGLSDKQIAALQYGFETLNDPENEILFYLISNGFNHNDANIIFNQYKMDTMEVINENPFRIYTEIYSMGFDKVKRFASKLEFEDAENKYKEAYLIYLLNEYFFNTGDLYIELDDLNNIKAINQISNLEEIIEKDIDNNLLVLENNRLYLYKDYYDEKLIAHKLNNLDSNLSIDDDLIEEGIELLENQLNITYDDKQIEAIYNFFKNNFSIIVGGPGTGKTTIIKSMSAIFNQYLPYDNLIVVAPTGRAAKRINEICNVESKTIHSLLRWDKETNTFVFNEENPILYDAIIIDEFSMVDNNLFAALLKASKKVKKFCIIGDNNQLPSIRPGNLLSDLIESNKFKVTILNNNYRQAQGSEIIELANDIIFDQVDLDKYNQDIIFYDNNVDLISLIRQDLDAGYNMDDIQVLTPMHKGIFGIDNLNNMIQKAFNPYDLNKNEREVGQKTFREFDKIIQLKNRPSDDVYNGDIGILIEISNRQKYFLIDYSDTYVFYQFDDLQDIDLAYAMSVHKAQGSEYQIVYFILNKNNLHMLNKNLIYTAISRAKKKLVIIDEESLFLKGLTRRMNKRKTSLLEKLL